MSPCSEDREADRPKPDAGGTTGGGTNGAYRPHTFPSDRALRTPTEQASIRRFDASTFLDRLGVDEHPYLLEHASVHMDREERNSDDEGEFAFGLDLILDSLERIRAS